MFSEKQLGEIPSNLREALKTISEPEDRALWLHKQSGKLIIKHYALERLATEKGIEFDPPLVIESDIANKGIAVSVTAHLEEKTEWSIGEAAPYNNVMNYPYAMAEKRAKDRVILKLLDVHGQVYSQEEADDFDDNRSELKQVKEYLASVIEFVHTISAVKLGIESKDYSTAGEAWYELPEQDRQRLWLAHSKGGCFTTSQQRAIKEDLRKAYYGDDWKGEG
jgi:hypothetical protein